MLSVIHFALFCFKLITESRTRITRLRETRNNLPYHPLANTHTPTHPCFSHTHTSLHTYTPTLVSHTHSCTHTHTPLFLTHILAHSHTLVSHTHTLVFKHRQTSQSWGVLPTPGVCITFSIQAGLESAPLRMPSI